MGPDFYPAYLALLRDTGSMTAEELAHKHLSVDITSPHFWRASIAIARTKISLFEGLLSECGL
jgi:oligoendopeptidase F